MADTVKMFVFIFAREFSSLRLAIFVLNKMQCEPFFKNEKVWLCKTESSMRSEVEKFRLVDIELFLHSSYFLSLQCLSIT